MSTSVIKWKAPLVCAVMFAQVHDD